MKIYTDVVSQDKQIVGYMLVGEHNQEYALNIFEAQTSKNAAVSLGIMRAINWVKVNKPLYCDLSDITYYSSTELKDNEYLKQYNIKRGKPTDEDLNRLHRVNQNIIWKYKFLNIGQNSR